MGFGGRTKPKCLRLSGFQNITFNSQPCTVPEYIRFSVVCFGAAAAIGMAGFTDGNITRCGWQRAPRSSSRGQLIIFCLAFGHYCALRAFYLYGLTASKMWVIRVQRINRQIFSIYFGICTNGYHVERGRCWENFSRITLCARASSGDDIGTWLSVMVFSQYSSRFTHNR